VSSAQNAGWQQENRFKEFKYTVNGDPYKTKRQKQEPDYRV